MALSRWTAAWHRFEARKTRTDMREWQVRRRERTRKLIELAGLIVKAGLVELTDDYGAFLTVAAKLQGGKGNRRWCSGSGKASGV